MRRTNRSKRSQSAVTAQGRSKDVLQDRQSTTAGTLLTPSQRRALDRLRLEATRVIRGLTGGRHRTSSQGSSLEFREHRPYVAGDELRQLDWKLYGKTDRLYVRQFEDQSDLRYLVLLDQSGSMAYPLSESDLHVANKHGFAVRLTAALATLCAQQGDSVGLVTFDQQVDRVLSPRRGRNHLALFMRYLVESTPKGETSLATALDIASQKLHHRRSTVVLVSDLFDTPERVLQATRRIMALGHEVIVFHVLHDDEVEFPFSGHIEFHSLEAPSEKRLVDPNAVATKYRSDIQGFCDRLSSAYRELGVRYQTCRVSEDLVAVLRRLISSRRKSRSRP